MEFLTKPIEDFAALAERNPLAASLVLALVISGGIFALLRTIFKQRAASVLVDSNLKLRELEFENQRMQRELDNARRKDDSAADNETLGRLPGLLTLAFEQAGKAISPQIQVFNERFIELINEQKRNNDLTEHSTRQRELQQQQLLTINKQGFNDLGIRINDKIDDMVSRVEGMKDEVIDNLGKQIKGMFEEVQQEISKLPDATAQTVATILEQHKQDIDAQLKTILAEIRANQTQPITPVEPPPEVPND